MEPFSAQFLSGLVAIIAIDLILAGDNAIVIALAARGVPRSQQRSVIVWGTLGAVVVRILLTLAVVWLLTVPGLMLAGGLLLIWIAYALVAQDSDSREVGNARRIDSFWAAMSTIIVADAVMGLDNMLAVAGAAGGSMLLVVLGLLISIPIMVWGSTFVLRWIDRFPLIIYAGGAILAWTAAKMIAGEQLIADYLADRRPLYWTVYPSIIGAVLVLGWLRNRQRRTHSARRTAQT